MNFRPYFCAAFGETLDDLWPPNTPEPMRSLGRYDAVLDWMKKKPSKVREVFGRPAPTGRIDAQDLVSFVAFCLEKNPTRASSRELLEEMFTPSTIDPTSAEVLLSTAQEYSVVQLISAADFDREGLRMKHCLRSFLHYYNEHERGEIAILSVRLGDLPVATIEVDLRPHRVIHRVVQLQGPQNGALGPDVSRPHVRGLLRSLGLEPHLFGRWRQRLEDEGVSRPMEAAKEADECLDRLLYGLRHGHQTRNPTAADLLQTGMPYVQAAYATPTLGVYVEIHAETYTPLLRVTCGDRVYTGSSWAAIEAARVDHPSPSPTVTVDATLTEAGTHFRLRLAALPGLLA